MRRTSLKRRAPLSRTWMRRRPRKPRPGDDPGYLSAVRQLPCAARNLTPCMGRIEAHHPRHRGGSMGRTAPDSEAIPLCHVHHVIDLHTKSGAFRGWPRGLMRAWQDEQVAATKRALGRAA